MQYDCKHVKEKLSLYIDDMLCDDEKEAVCAHLEACSDCRSEYEFLSRIVQTANTMPAITASAGLHAKIMQAATGQTKEKPARKSLWRRASGFAAAVAVIAISVVSFNSLPGHPDLTTEPTTDIQTTIAPSPLPTETADAPTEGKSGKTVTEPSATAAPQNHQRYAASPTPAAPQEAAAPAAEDVPAAPAAVLAEEPADVSGEAAEPEAGIFSRSRPEEAVTCYYIAEESYEEAVLILDVYEFDGLSYRIPVGEAEAVCAKLEGLSGYVRHTEEASEGEFVHITLACE